MASSNRHWPSMFKSKPCNPLHQWQHDLINPSSLLSGCHRNPYTSGVEERNPEPKPRWNPKPEQIRILEAIFNSGMVNPPRDEIRKIRVQLQEFGQVGDANVFYWFQNRKSRSKNKNRQPSKNQSTKKFTATPTMITKVPSSSSSSSDKSSSKLNSSKTTYSPTGFSLGSCSSSQHLDQLHCSPTASVNQTYDQQLVQQEPFMFPTQQQLNFSTQGRFTGFPDHQAQHQQMMMLNNNANNDLINIPHSVGPCTEFLMFNELINNSKKDAEDEEKLMMMKLGYAADPSATSSVSNNVPVSDSTAGNMPLHPTLSQLQGADHSSGSAIAGPMKSTVLINDVAFDVNCGPFHVREAFGNDAVLLHSTGQPVLTDEWGVTLQPLLHGAFYYLI
ncbi:hypothetical protein QQ045_011939 [Rhodiola kirilowii]